ncbi:MAG: hypothetical protein M1308_08715 [Actinobacteria bacterium]|nr:hypothetical protein [Actinomycetota bacterium]
MNKKTILVVFILSLSLLLFLISLKSFSFNTDIIWKIEEQRREHVYSFSSSARLIHNKGSYAGSAVIDNYLSYYSPSVFFCCGRSLVGFIILIFFYGALYILLKHSSLPARIALASFLIYPLFLALMFQKPSFILMLPLIILTSGVVIYSLYSKIKN